MKYKSIIYVLILIIGGLSWLSYDYKIKIDKDLAIIKKIELEKDNYINKQLKIDKKIKEQSKMIITLNKEKFDTTNKYLDLKDKLTELEKNNLSEFDKDKLNILELLFIQKDKKKVKKDLRKIIGKYHKSKKIKEEKYFRYIYSNFL